MKKLEFETSKDKFVLVDSIGRENYYEVIRDWIDKCVNIEFISLLKNITEKQASEVVEISFDTPRMYKDYVSNLPGLSAIESLHSLIESKGWHLFENPFKGEHPNDEYVAEDYTLYNPYLFRIKN